jgi:hypothetical protein
MLRIPIQRTDHLRFIRRISARSVLPVHLRCLRPSLSGWGYKGDAWLEDQGNGTIVMRLGERPYACITGLPLDLPSLTRLLDGVGLRRPRGTHPAKTGP